MSDQNNSHPHNTSLNTKVSWYITSMRLQKVRERVNGLKKVKGWESVMKRCAWAYVLREIKYNIILAYLLSEQESHVSNGTFQLSIIVDQEGVLLIGVLLIGALRHVVTHSPTGTRTPVGPLWLMTVVAWLWADPELCWPDYPDEASWAASATLILPPNWKSFLLIWDLSLV